MEAFIKYSPPVVFILAAFYFLYKSKNRQRWVNKVGYSMVFVPFAWFYLGIGPFITDYVDALMAEKALAEQMEQGGFVDEREYLRAQFLNIPTKALYDKHLEEQAEILALNREKRKAEKARLEREQRLAEQAEKRKAERAAEERNRTVGSIRIKSGYIYKYYTDGSCKPRSNEICISKSDYKVFCSRSPSIGVMYDVANSMSILSNGKFAQLIRNGVRPKSRISLQGDTCVITSEATGMLNGSRVSDSFRGKVVSFYVDTNYRVTVEGALR